MVRTPVFKLLKSYLQQATEAVAGLDFYAELTADVEKQKANILAVYNEFKKQMEDKEYIGKLTVQEQHVLGRNELNYKQVLREIDETLSQLMVHKWSQNTRTTLWLLDDLSLTIDDVITGPTFKKADIGQPVKPKRLLNEKKFAKADYIGKIAMCQTLLEIVRDDVLDVVSEDNSSIEMVKFTLSLGIGKSIRVLQREIEDREANGAPELIKFTAPEILEPEIPDAAPEPEKDAEQLEIPLEEKEEYPGAVDQVAEAHDAQLEEKEEVKSDKQ